MTGYNRIQQNMTGYDTVEQYSRLGWFELGWIELGMVALGKVWQGYVRSCLIKECWAE
jgi:hypothetical protein